MRYKVFYAWQMDTHKNVCRWFIHKAAEEATDIVSDNLKVQDAPAVDAAERPENEDEPEVELDWAMKGEPGTPAIADTILRKISECGVFLADVTLVAERTTADGRKKRLPNPNVMIELGAAIMAVGWQRIILVMNTAFGSPEDLPFDLRHRAFPITYALSGPADPEKAKKRKELAKGIADNLQAMKDKGVYTKAEQDATKAKTDAERQQQETCEGLRRAFEQSLIDNKHKVFRGKRGIFALSIFPLTPPTKSLQLNNEFGTKNMRRLAPMRANEGDPCPATRSIMFRFTKRQQYEDNAVTEITTDGHLSAVDHWINYDTDYKDPAVVMPLQMYNMEAVVVQVVSSYLEVLKEYGVVGPWLLGMSLLHCRNYQLHPYKRPLPHHLNPPYTEDHIRTDSIVIPADLDPTNKPDVGTSLSGPLNQVWRSFGFMTDPNFDDKGNFRRS